MEAAVTPFPTEETTPPVQKMNLTISTYGESTKPRSVLSRPLHISAYDSLPASVHSFDSPQTIKNHIITRAPCQRGPSTSRLTRPPRSLQFF